MPDHFQHTGPTNPNTTIRRGPIMSAEDYKFDETSINKIKSAWYSLKPRIESPESGLAQSIIKDNVGFASTVPCKMEICDLLNGLFNPSPQPYSADGEGTITLSDCVLSEWTNVQLAEANFLPPSEIELPVTFDSLIVRGKFKLSQPCALTSPFGDKWELDGPDGSRVPPCEQEGTFVESSKNGKLTYVAFSRRLIFDRVVVSGDQNLTVSIGSDWPEMLQSITGYLLLPVRQRIQENLVNIFQNSGFFNQMKDFIEKQINE